MPGVWDHNNDKLGYLKDNNAAAHSIDSDIFYAVTHLQLHPCVIMHEVVDESLRKICHYQ